MPTDLRAAVLRGLDEKIKHITALDVCDCREYPPTKDALTALGHLREIVEWHDGFRDGPLWRCDVCGTFQAKSCPTLLSLAPEYAPGALKEKA